MDYVTAIDTSKQVKISIKDFFSKCDQICRRLWICAIEEIFNGKLQFFVP